MVRSELLKKMSNLHPNIIRREMEEVLEIILLEIMGALCEDKNIEIRGFGSFSLNFRPSRVGRNPKSGTKVHVPEKYVPHFKAGKELRIRVDK